MRLKQSEVEVIKHTILKYISDAKIILFGSRVDDTKRGGDIDIFIETQDFVTLKQQIKIMTDLEINGIGRKVDMVFKTPTTKQQSIFETIYQEGIVL